MMSRSLVVDELHAKSEKRFNVLYRCRPYVLFCLKFLRLSIICCASFCPTFS